MRAKLLIAAMCAMNIVLGFIVGVAADRACLASQDTATVTTASTPAPEASPSPVVAESPAPSTAPVRSRSHRRRGRRGGHMLRHMTQRLNLDKAQAEQVGEILKGMRKRFHLAFKAVRPKLNALHEESNAAIRALLTPEQQVHFDALKTEHEQRRKDMKRRGWGRDRGRSRGRRGPPWARRGKRGSISPVPTAAKTSDR
jgi:Spy/CpxP family protein refolding chaperone